jgi:hypothetical protein
MLMSLKYGFAALPVTKGIFYLLSHESAKENCSDSLTIFSTCTSFGSYTKSSAWQFTTEDRSQYIMGGSLR